MNLVEYLPWDSSHFRHRIGRVVPDALSQSELHAVLTWALDEQIECLYYLVGANQIEAVHLAEQAGFRFMDIRITLEQDLGTELVVDQLKSKPAKGINFRRAEGVDIPELEGIAQMSFALSRFYSDPNFSAASCAEMYRLWLVNNFHSARHAVLVAEHADQIAGFVTLSLPPIGGISEIGLFGIHPSVQSQGLGQNLLQYALEWLKSCGRNRVRVVTQGANLGAQRLYQRGGFITTDVQIWYHKWFTE